MQMIVMCFNPMKLTIQISKLDLTTLKPNKIMMKIIKEKTIQFLKWLDLLVKKEKLCKADGKVMKVLLNK